MDVIHCWLATCKNVFFFILVLSVVHRFKRTS